MDVSTWMYISAGGYALVGICLIMAGLADIKQRSMHALFLCMCAFHFFFFSYKGFDDANEQYVRDNYTTSELAQYYAEKYDYVIQVKLKDGTVINAIPR